MDSSSSSEAPSQVPSATETPPPIPANPSNQESEEALQLRTVVAPPKSEEQSTSEPSPSSPPLPKAPSETIEIGDESYSGNPSLITVIDNRDASVVVEDNVAVNTIIENEKHGSIEDRSRNDDSDKNDDSARSGDSDRNESADEGLSDNTSNSSSGSQKGRRSNRCQVCRKKVGLTGFTCRCGGLFCSLHRYSDKHDCSFNYRELGAEEIRKNNPVISGEKVNKI